MTRSSTGFQDNENNLHKSLSKSKHPNLRTHQQDTIKKIEQLEKIREKKGLNPHLLRQESARARQSESVNFRRNLLESQYRKNYIHEYEKIVGILSTQRLLHLPENQHLKKRKEELKSLAKQSVNPQLHEIFLEN